MFLWVIMSLGLDFFFFGNKFIDNRIYGYKSNKIYRTIWSIYNIHTCTHIHITEKILIGDNANIEKYVNRMRSNVCVGVQTKTKFWMTHAHTHTNDYHRNYSQFLWISKFQMKFFINEIEAKKCHYEAIIMNDESFFSVKKN